MAFQVTPDPTFGSFALGGRPLFTRPDVYERLAALPECSLTQQEAAARGLQFTRVSWEDTSKYWGTTSVQSDLTLELVGDHGVGTPVPVLRSPIYADNPWLVDASTISLNVSNWTRDGSPATMSLVQLLASPYYVHDKSEGLGGGALPNVYAALDTHVLMTTQACFLPMNPRDPVGSHVEFCIAINVTPGKAVMVFVATKHGTMVQFVPGGKVHRLFFKKHYVKYLFAARRLDDQRAMQGSTSTAPMTAEEKEDNVLFIFQVPLKLRDRASEFSFPHAGRFPGSSFPSFGAAGPFRDASLFSGGAAPAAAAFGSAAPATPAFGTTAPPAARINVRPTAARSAPVAGAVRFAEGGTHDAILGRGRPVADTYEEYFNLLEWERDRESRVRVTAQFYKITTTGVILDRDLDAIVTQFYTARAPHQPPPPLISGLPLGLPCLHCLKLVTHCGSPFFFRCMQCANFVVCAACTSLISHSPPHHVLMAIRNTPTAFNFLYANDRSLAKHSSSCHHCGENQPGVRYKCCSPPCPAFDKHFCESCDALVGHQTTTGHNMVRLLK
jgi:hypothetical protein